jgi:hypothetical protein
MRRPLPHVSLALCAVLLIGMMVMWKGMSPAIKRIIENRHYAQLWVAP